MSTLLYEGKAKKIFSTDQADEVCIYYKDDATAFNGEKKGQIHDKGILNNKMSGALFEFLAQRGIPTHFIKTLSDRETLARKVAIIPLEVVVRNIVAGSLAKRLGWEEGKVLAKPIIEFYYKDDELGDPLINNSHIQALNAATPEEIARLETLASEINALLQPFFLARGVLLVDFKLEFGKDAKGNIYLADEISPDTCRFWDKATKEKLDKDRFRRDLGNVEGAYHEMFDRITAGV